MYLRKLACPHENASLQQNFVGLSRSPPDSYYPSPQNSLMRLRIPIAARRVRCHTLLTPPPTYPARAVEKSDRGSAARAHEGSSCRLDRHLGRGLIGRQEAEGGGSTWLVTARLVGGCAPVFSPPPCALPQEFAQAQ